MKRRRFIAGAALIGAAACGAMYGFDRSADRALEGWLRERVADDDIPRDPGDVGQVDTNTLGVLLGLFAFIGDHWGLPSTGAARDALLMQLLEAKTTIAPSYRREYREAAEVIDRIGRVTGAKDAAYLRIFATSAADEDARLTRLGRAHRLVAGEFVTWFMAMDGFARHGYRNYRGYMGGSYASSPPPYRSLPASA